MAKKKDNKQLVPNILGLELDIAGDVLDDQNIKYKIEDKKIITFFRDKNCVAKTVPRRNKPIDKDEVLKIYPSKCKIGPLLIILILAITWIVMYINKHSIVPLFFSEPTISQESNNWESSKIVYITDDADFNYSKVDYYKYCINKSKSSDSCDWKDTYTKNVRVSASGTWYVWFKAVSEDNNESYLSNRLKVTVDNESPTIISLEKTVTRRSIEIRVNAKDTLSGINKYYYSIDNQEFIEGSKSYTFTSLDENKTYSIRVRVEDKVGNIIEASMKISTSGSNKNNETTTLLNKTIPQISLIDLPNTIIEKDKYYLPTNVTPSKYSEDTICYADNIEVTNTSNLSLGEHKIKCTSTIDNLSITIYKDINVVLDYGKDEIINDYVKLNLDYNKEAINYMYRIETDNTRTDEDKWEYYTGPLYIKKELIDKVIIKYDLNGERIITRDDLYLDIKPDSYIVNDGDQTWININYSNREDKVYYSINGVDYQEYKHSFKVYGDTTVNAYIVRTFKTYDSNTNQISEIKMTKKDSVYIQNKYPKIGDKNNTDVYVHLHNLPEVIDDNKVYSIPSNYSYGVHGSKNLVCTANGKKVNSTSDLTPGEYDIVCTISANDGETKIATKHIEIKKSSYKYDLDDIPYTIIQGESYKLDNTCNITNTSKLKEGKYTITCGNISKDIEVVKINKLSIDFNNIPSTITVGDMYELPSHIRGNNIKYIKCIDEDNNLIYNTKTLSIGKHTITCIVKTDDEIITSTKEINVIKPKYLFDILK